MNNTWKQLTSTYIHTNNAVNRIIAINVTVFIILMLLSVVSFLFQFTNLSSLIQSYLTLPASFDKLLFKPWSIVTYMFLHSGFFHLLFNMLWLYWLGNLVQEYLGNKHVYRLYFFGGVFGGLLFILAFNFFPAFNAYKDIAFALGASAGVLSIVIASATLLPNYEVQLLLLGFVKLKWIAIVVVILDVIGIERGNSGGHIAHLGGAVLGFFYIKHLYGKASIHNLFSKLGFNRKKLKIVHKSTTPVQQEEIDAVLDKISKSGYDSLTKREKEILFKASKQ